MNTNGVIWKISLKVFAGVRLVLLALLLGACGHGGDEEGADSPQSDDETIPGIGSQDEQDRKWLFAVSAYKWYVEAGQSGLIEADLSARREIAEDNYYLLSNVNGERKIAIVASDRTTVVAESSLHVGVGIDLLEVLPKVYKQLPLAGQPLQYARWSFSINGQRNYDAVAVKTGAGMLGPTADWWLYEDLTDYYQARFPEANVQSVVLLQILRCVVAEE